jgi:hypothetical protein
MPESNIAPYTESSLRAGRRTESRETHALTQSPQMRRAPSCRSNESTLMRGAHTTGRQRRGPPVLHAHPRMPSPTSSPPSHELGRVTQDRVPPDGRDAAPRPIVRHPAPHLAHTAPRGRSRSPEVRRAPREPLPTNDGCPCDVLRHLSSHCRGALCALHAAADPPTHRPTPLCTWGWGQHGGLGVLRVVGAPRVRAPVAGWLSTLRRVAQQPPGIRCFGAC